MPTPVSSARQCLTVEAAQALDDAVGVARQRSHAQTTSLHAVSALLAQPSSVLREACSRARSSAYSPRLQFRALELCFRVALDRIPSSQTVDEPLISNSLMAAIKRSQANQRRHPENFHLYQQQQQQQQSSISCVKVELRHLILSVLDDPVVSRVFGEAGFRSCDIKLAIIRPPPPLVRYSRSRCPPIFLCNLNGGDSEPGRRSFSFPFSGFSGYSGFSDGDENCRRIGEVLAKKNGRNPLLIGACANDALRSFSDCVERGKGGVLPVEISGLNFICMEKELSEFITESGSEELLGSRIEELGRIAGHCSGPGVVVNFGDLKVFVSDGGSVDAVSYVVSQLTGLLELQRGNLWLMGAAASYETYLKFLNRFPSIVKDWDLQPLSITSVRPFMGGFYSKPSLKDSFVPFGSFFSTPSNLKGPLSSTDQSIYRCRLCNEKYEQEAASVADQYKASLPSWAQTAELSTNKELDVAKVCIFVEVISELCDRPSFVMKERDMRFLSVQTKDDGTILNAKSVGLQKKWNDICQHLHRTRPLPEADCYMVGSQVPSVVGFQCIGDRKSSADNQNSSSTNASPNISGCENLFPCKSTDLQLQKISPPKPGIPIPAVFESKENFQLKLWLRPSKIEHLGSEGLCFPPYPLTNSGMPDNHAAPSSATSVTTDLGLGTLYASTGKELKKPTYQATKECQQGISGCFPSEVDLFNRTNSNHPARSSSCSSHLGGKFEPRDFKTLWRLLTEKVGWQDEAICAISQTVAYCRTGSERRRGASLRGDIWLCFLGPDRVGKKRIATALAEIIFGTRENLVCVDLSSQDGMIQSNTIVDRQEINGYDVKFRGKTVVDYIAAELSKKPLSVVFLENVDKADLLAQNSLSRAIRNGKFSDSHGREISINNAIFVTTSRVTKRNKMVFSENEPISFSEERIFGAKGWQIQILIGCVLGNTIIRNDSNVLVTLKGTSNPVHMNKRKLFSTSEVSVHGETLEMAKRAHKASNTYLDLNLPVEEMNATNIDNGNYDSDSISEISEAWLDDFFKQVDETVDFKPFDFDALAEKILKEIRECFQKTIGSEGLLEIDSLVMEQILAAAWLSDRERDVEDWVDQVLNRSFTEVHQRYSLTARSVVKLVTCEGLSVEEQAPGVCLPARIILN
ncbi:hypothetical protein HHK36_018852 [Tetracentron sinense]|uniref:Clp R domain-containing protein n=1 Tax=Tetracentron sinense TaxID=13715 RepID=A0A834YYX0_TETSI|nr:hypothetical protein HHK36_018852 [Tetracentron sinense]